MERTFLHGSGRNHETGEKASPLSQPGRVPILPAMKKLVANEGGERRFAPAKVLLFVCLGVLGGWGGMKVLRAGREGWVPPPAFRLSRWKPLHVRRGEPRLLPWVHRDFELFGRVVVPRDDHMDLVFHLERGPYQVSSRDDRTWPQGPLDWSALRLSAGDLGPPFFSSRNLPAKGGGWRVPPGQPVDVHLVLEGGTARAEAGHKALPGAWKVHTREGLLAFVGEGTWEALRLKSLDKKDAWTEGLLGGLLWLGGAFLLAWAWRRIRFPGTSLLWGGALAGCAAWAVSLLPGPPSKDPWDPRKAPSFREALALYGRPEGFRNWGAYAGSLYWRGRGATWFSRTGGKRVLFLGGPQVWGRGVARKDLTFPMQVEGILEGTRTPGTPSVEVLVGACRETDLGRQLRILDRDLLSFHPDLVVLVVPSGSKGPGTSRKDQEKLVEGFAARMNRLHLPFLVIPPLVKNGGAFGDSSLERKVRAAGGRVWDPSPLWKEGREGFFLSSPSGMGRKGDLSAKGHLLLAPPLARILREMIPF